MANDASNTMQNYVFRPAHHFSRHRKLKLNCTVYFWQLLRSKQNPIGGNIHRLCNILPLRRTQNYLKVQRKTHRSPNRQRIK